MISIVELIGLMIGLIICRVGLGFWAEWVKAEREEE